MDAVVAAGGIVNGTICYWYVLLALCLLLMDMEAKVMHVLAGCLHTSYLYPENVVCVFTYQAARSGVDVFECSIH
jgi:hypothetical protein